MTYLDARVRPKRKLARHKQEHFDKSGFTIVLTSTVKGTWQWEVRDKVSGKIRHWDCADSTKKSARKQAIYLAKRLRDDV